MKTIKEKLQLRLLCRIYMKLKHVFLICAEFLVKKTEKTSASSFYKENNFKPCLTNSF